MNTCIFGGHLTRDPELKFLQKGTAIGQFTVANNRTWKTETGEKKESVSFLDVKCWGKQAETIAQYFRKGSPIMVQCRAEQESWEDKQTQAKRSKIVFVLESFEFMGGKNDSASAPAPAQKPEEKPTPAEGAEKEDDEIPF